MTNPFTKLWASLTSWLSGENYAQQAQQAALRSSGPPPQPSQAYPEPPREPDLSSKETE